MTVAVLTQGAIISVLDKKGNKAFQKLITGLGGKTAQVDKTPRGEGYVPPGVKKVDPPKGRAQTSKKDDLLG